MLLKQTSCCLSDLDAARFKSVAHPLRLRGGIARNARRHAKTEKDGEVRTDGGFHPLDKVSWALFEIKATFRHAKAVKRANALGLFGDTWGAMKQNRPRSPIISR